MSRNLTLVALVGFVLFALASCVGTGTHSQARRLCDEYLDMIRSLDTEGPIPATVVDRASDMISSEDHKFIDRSYAVYAERDEAAWREYLSDPRHSAVEAVWFRNALEADVADAEGFRRVALEVMLRYDFAVFNNSPVYGTSTMVEPSVTEVTYGVPAALGARDLIGRPFLVAEENGEMKLAYLKNIERYNLSLRRMQAQRASEAADEEAATLVDHAMALL